MLEHPRALFSSQCSAGMKSYFPNTRQVDKYEAEIQTNLEINSKLRKTRRRGRHPHLPNGCCRLVAPECRSKTRSSAVWTHAHDFSWLLTMQLSHRLFPENQDADLTWFQLPGKADHFQSDLQIVKSFAERLRCWPCCRSGGTWLWTCFGSRWQHGQLRPEMSHSELEWTGKAQIQIQCSSLKMGDRALAGPIQIQTKLWSFLQCGLEEEHRTQVIAMATTARKCETAIQSPDVKPSVALAVYSCLLQSNDVLMTVYIPDTLPRQVFGRGSKRCGSQCSTPVIRFYPLPPPYEMEI